ncbi:dihydrolipoamide acetyltransferase family protein [Tropicibacter oceani]|uniref:Dihydrolipoamide acetyltransferase component of pyruvate dehydrogenase complex n=1 Tax=Tropicibacter oceani TaxID=3058420 RepID=A0ABY8QPR4_9RHOB|nr:dihydrolipoamide acetyltransferase family protein [Tropicibacter oceani]WGW06021.1 dihydrolipoamide acetyltransferase family protein [Tropicibacter oceani]
MSAFVMPSLGADMEAGVLVEQLIAPGDPVQRGDVIGAVETQKGVIEIEVFESGTLAEWLVPLGTKVPVGTPLAMIDTGAQDVPDPDEPDIPDPEEPTELPEEPPTELPDPEQPFPDDPIPEDLPYDDPGPSEPMPEIPPFDPGMRLRITPAARRLAAQSGVDPRALSLPLGRAITRADILGLAPTSKPPPQFDMRAAIAAAMSRSKREIPHYYLSHMVDLTAAEGFVSALNKDRAPQDRVLLGAVVARAVAHALRKFPEFNGHYDGSFVPSQAVHLGMAINIRGGGLVAPALFDAADKPLDALMRDMADLVERVRAGRFRARELSDATITLTSLGDRGVDELLGVIYPPQVAIVGMGTPRLHPMIHDGQVAARLAARLTLAADHRVSDGHRGALFLRAIDKHLQKPDTP